MKLSLLPFALTAVVVAGCAGSSNGATNSQDDTAFPIDVPINLHNTQAAVNVSPGDTTILTYANTFWEGELTFDAVASGSASMSYAFIDGAGVKTPVTQTTHLAGAKLPVKLVASSNFAGLAIVQVKNVSLSLDSVKPPTYTGVLADKMVETNVDTLGDGFPGATLHFDATAQFANTFDNGSKCSSIRLVDATAKVVTFNHDFPTQTALALVTPVQVISDSTCPSTHLDPTTPTPDYTFTISNFAVADQ